jgi:hypothetical protein
VNELAERYGVTHLVVAKWEFRESRIRSGKVYRPQYQELVRQLARAPGRFVLDPPPRDSVIFEDADFWLVRLPLELPVVDR